MTDSLEKSSSIFPSGIAPDAAFSADNRACTRTILCDNCGPMRPANLFCQQTGEEVSGAARREWQRRFLVWWT
jgi:hypothetical protein